MSLMRPCLYCGNYHFGTCSRIKSIEYHLNGTVKRIEFHEVQTGVDRPIPPRKQRRPT